MAASQNTAANAKTCAERLGFAKPSTFSALFRTCFWRNRFGDVGQTASPLNGVNASLCLCQHIFHECRSIPYRF